MSEIPDEILRRVYRIKGGGEVTLVVYRPKAFDDSPDMCCEFDIIGLPGQSRQFAGGVDAIQSLLLALKMAATDLVTSAEFESGRLYWLEEGDTDLGLPLPKALGKV
jgi:hypothetical protein